MVIPKILNDSALRDADQFDEKNFDVFRSAVLKGVGLCKVKKHK